MSKARRGRPPSASIPQKIAEGLASDSPYKCDICFRGFPRRKSLRIHYYLHTDEKPYVCDYPGCIGKFKQSGHLRSHALRHTGEKPFRCPFDTCKERYMHSSRNCTVHTELKLVRDGKEFINVNERNLSEDEQQWIQRYRYKKYHSKGKKRSAERCSDEENIPVNNKRSQNHGLNSSGSESLSASPCSSPDLTSPCSSPVLTSPCSSPVLMNNGYNYTKSVLPFGLRFSYPELDERDLEGAWLLLQFKYRMAS